MRRSMVNNFKSIRFTSELASIEVRKVYVDARYKPSYVIQKDEIIQLALEVNRLQAIGEQLCLAKIASFAL